MKALSPAETTALLETLAGRFRKNPHRHPGLDWKDVEDRLRASSSALKAIAEMERTGGEPDAVVGDSGAVLFIDCSRQTPSKRRSLCYDQEAREGRKKHPPKSSALEMAREMGVEILTEEEYRYLQTLEPLDTTTSSWLLTPPDIRERGGAIFGDRRYDTVFRYHNGADSYYAARGFRAKVPL